MVPVEIMLIRDIPMVSIHSPASATEPKALTGRPSPIITSHKLTLDVSEPDLMEEQLVPRLNFPDSHQEFFKNNSRNENRSHPKNDNHGKSVNLSDRHRCLTP